ncbi:hypothetical protein FEZ60_31755 [Rhodococcus sp. MS16]|uniref:hypothetical protein n=1 Tax=Rhodococcus TaxID=1827 RepID=UPI001561BE83|nr:MULTISPECIES: hypothetical protein [Rhodococcus]MCE4267508.1 hypothetical protein [Rhodococcus globerulus]NRI70080.1 hypothetical protein [Rhodococcus sp. MS16]
MVGAYGGNGGRSPDLWPSRYGADDRIGSRNALNPFRTLASLRIPKSGVGHRIDEALGVNVLPHRTTRTAVGWSNGMGRPRPSSLRRWPGGF